MSPIRAPLPLRTSLLRGALEATVIYAVLLLTGAVLNGFGSGTGPPPAIVLVALAWLSLAVWPAWRIQVASGRHWWSRLARGAGRAALIVASLTIVAVLVNGAIGGSTSAWPFAGVQPSKSPAVVVALALGFSCSRIVILTGAWVIGKMHQRLRWELMASHIAVIVLTFAVLTSLGSIVAAGVALQGTQPNAVEMARSVREDLQLTGQPMDPRRAHRVFEAVMRGTLPSRGQPILSVLVKGSGIPGGVALFDRNGRLLTGIQTQQGTIQARSWQGVPELTPATWAQLHTAALQGLATSVPTHIPGTAPPAQTTLAEAPIRGTGGKTVGMVVLLARGLDATSLQFVQAVIVLFSASTIVLTIMASVPLVALSFLFSYLVARGLTRRLEAVSRVAGAVAAGNFTERAPVSAQNEVGRLADDINRMAEQQERMVGELRQARYQAEEALQTRQRLIADVSHELRTPLAILRAQLESLGMRSSVTAGGSSTSEVTVPATAVEALQGETLRLESLIDDLFALSRAETGSLEVDCREIDVATIVDDVATLMGPLARSESAIALSTDVPPGLPLTMADPDRLRQILSNLVRNAIRHTPEGGIVVLLARREGDRVAITVADTGEGIEPEHLPHLFERLYRADPSRARETGGAGLGLAIVRELVEIMGGSVSVESSPGQGSRFTVTLPAVVV